MTKAVTFCENCNAPKKPASAWLFRCGLCAIINGKVPPTKYIPIKKTMRKPS